MTFDKIGEMKGTSKYVRIPLPWTNPRIHAWLLENVKSGFYVISQFCIRETII